VAVCDGSFAAICVGSFAITSAGSFLTGGFGFLEVKGIRFFVIAFTGLSEVVDVDFCVITWTMSSAFF
jgi:hypothetical protein